MPLPYKIAPRVKHRDWCLGRVTAFCYSEAAARGSPSKNDHTFALASGLSGRGKTYFAVACRFVPATAALLKRNGGTLIGVDEATLREVGVSNAEKFMEGFLCFRPVFETQMPALHDVVMRTVFVYTTFNNDSMLDGSGVCKAGRDTVDVADGIRYHVVMRILHACFGQRGQSFDAFSSEVLVAFPFRGWGVDAGDVALRVIAHLKGATATQPVLFLLVVDEFQRVGFNSPPAKFLPLMVAAAGAAGDAPSTPVSVAFNGVPVQALVDVIGVLVKQPAGSVYSVCALFAGLMLEPIVAAGARSSMKVLALPLQSLTLADGEAIADEVLPKEFDWRSCSNARRMIWQSASVPKALVEGVLQPLRDGQRNVGPLRAKMLGVVSWSIGMDLIPGFLRLLACVVVGSTDYVPATGLPPGVFRPEHGGDVLKAWDEIGCLVSIDEDPVSALKRVPTVPYAALVALAGMAPPAS